MRVEITTSAKRDLQEIYHYIAVENQAVDAADKLISDIIIQANDLLSQMPYSGRKISENERFTVIRQRTVHYKIEGDTVFIIGIYNKGRNWKSM